MKKWIVVFAMVGAAATLAACSNDAQVVSENLSKDADSFRIARRIVFYNGINGEYMLEIRGLCSLGGASTLPGKSITVTCKDDKGQYKKHYLGLSDNVTYFAEQIDAADASKSMYTVIFKPTSIIPNIQLS